MLSPKKGQGGGGCLSTGRGHYVGWLGLDLRETRAIRPLHPQSCYNFCIRIPPKKSQITGRPAADWDWLTDLHNQLKHVLAAMIYPKLFYLK